MYLLWWNEPLNVRLGVRVYKKRDAEQPADDEDVYPTNSVGFWGALGMMDKNRWLVRVLTCQWPAVISSVLVGEARRYGHPDLKRVRTFDPGREESCIGMAFDIAAFIVTAIILASGGIHCIGWSFTFPSGIEQTFWRVALVSIFIIPILLWLLRGASASIFE
ncbi:hypothetical protein F5148DRAFT_42056 [Russula earlei]|uniref:Uncharacterized protein n=1 Tax=Russula earlei TaxID=71964 RepID=A0ACC0U939_9AGAM|nr:hypothetical protein F5148DRAFT_42056 [Russula earlei]